MNPFLRDNTPPLQLTHLRALTLLALMILIHACKPEERNVQEPGWVISATSWEIVLEASIVGGERSVALIRKNTSQPLGFVARDRHDKIVESCRATKSMKKAFEASVLDIEVLDPLREAADQQRAASAQGEHFTLHVNTTIKGEEEYEVEIVRTPDKVLYGKTKYSKFWFTVDPSTLDALDYRCPK